LLRYRKDFFSRLGPAVELGRSFVRAEYQKQYAPLLLLWKGIGHYVASGPHFTTFCGHGRRRRRPTCGSPTESAAWSMKLIPPPG
jgi:putative hemolysin